MNFASYEPYINGQILSMFSEMQVEIYREYLLIILNLLPFPSNHFLFLFLHKGADTLSETSSISIAATTESRETSVATSILSPFTSGHSRDEADNRSEHSYSESGASGSSFEELELEGNGDGTEGSVEDQDTTNAKWTKEPIVVEKERSEE